MSGYQGNIIIKNPATPTGPAENGSAPGVWTLSEALAFKRQGVWPTQGVIPADPYFNYVSMLLSTTSLGNASNNLFVDSSGAFIPLSRNGNTTQGSMTPYGANWSNYFDGNSDNLTLPSSASYAIASSSTPFTVEAWIYPTAGGGCVFSEAFTGSGTIPIVISMSTGTSVDGLGGLYIGFGWFTGSAWVTAAIASSAVTANTWTHIACVFTGSTTKIYYNGVDVTKPSSPTPASSWGVTGVAGDSWYIGRRWDGAGSNWFSGYISNLRFVNGTAVYTSAFTPPTAPLTAIANTVLLTCQSNRFRDASTGNATITVVGDTRVTDFSPFSPGLPGITYNQSDITNWSGYFDGDGDYLTVPANSAFAFGTGDFTVEAWVYLNVITSTYAKPIVGNYYYSPGTGDRGWALGVSPSGNAIFYMYGNAGAGFVLTAPSALTASTWTHVAATRSGTTVKIFVNGTEVVSGTSAYNEDWTSTTLNIATGNATTLSPQLGNNQFSINGAISNVRIVKGTAVYTSNFTPSTTNLTAVSGTSLLTCQNAAFTDNSTNNFIITPNGNTTVTGNSPFNTVGYWSNYFDGNGDYLSFSATSALNQSGDFTIEAWIYLTATPSASTPIYAFEVTNFMKFGVNTSRNLLVDQANVGVRVTGTTALSLGTWNHIAFVRSGSGSNNCKIYLNGVQEGQFTDTSTATASGTGRICSRPDATSGFLTCYLSNLRVTNTAVYTSAFTPPTSPLTAISGTQLLTCQSGRFIDNSANAIGLTRNGDVTVQSFDPFYTSTIASNGGSMYFDGNGDYLTLPAGEAFQFGTGDFTVEMWVYPQNANGTDYFYLDARNSSQTGTWCLYRTSANALSWFNGSGEYTGGNVLTNQWSHLAYSRSGSSGRLFINGVLQTTATDNTNYSIAPTISYIGGRFSQQQYFSGYMNGLRVTKSALYTAAFTPPTAPLTPSASTRLLTNGMNAGIYDATAISDMETVGNAQVRFPTPFAPANYYAGSFNGSTDYLTVGSSSNLALGSGDFTVECWINPSSTPSQNIIFDWRASNNNNLVLYLSSGTPIWRVNTASAITGTAITTNTWTHLAVCRSGSTTTMYINGASVGSFSDSNNYLNEGLKIGKAWDSNYWGGLLSNARIVKGTAVYTSNFTPPTTPLTAITNTQLLTCQNKTFIDNSANAFTITANGNATAGAIGPFTATGGTSVYFDGSGDYLVAANQPTLNFGTGDFTIEMWINFNSFTGSIGVLGKRASEMNYSPIILEGNSNTLKLYMSTTGSSWQVNALSTGTLSTGVWYHYAVSRSGSTVYAFVNGVSVGSTGTASGPLMTNTDPMTIGQASVSISASVPLNGYIDDFRITNGYARYTSNFTPPTQPFVTY